MKLKKKTKKTMNLLFEEKVSKEFTAKVTDISKKLGINPNSLMLTMYIETAKTFNPAIQNKKSRATGLIQFMPATARNLGTTVDALKEMSALEQLDYVYKYLFPYKGRMKEFVDTYLAVFFPLAIGKPNDWVLETKSLPAKTIAEWNPLYDLNKDKKIQKGEIAKKIMEYLPKGFIV